MLDILHSMQEEDLYELDIPLKFMAAVGTRVHGLACWFDVLFNGRWVSNILRNTYITQHLCHPNEEMALFSLIEGLDEGYQPISA